MSIKIIRNRIKVISNTEKITYAMQMVSMSKMRKLQERVRHYVPYIKMLQSVLEHILSGNLVYQHAFLKTRNIKNMGLIAVGSDRGLCGSINSHLFKQSLQKIRYYQERGGKVYVTTVGSKAHDFFARIQGIELLASCEKLVDLTQDQEVVTIIDTMSQVFLAKKIDILYVAYNKFINSMNQQACIEKLLPIIAEEHGVKINNGDYIYEPDPKYLIDRFMNRYLQGMVHAKIVENMLCVEAARMLSMRTATNNAIELIKELTLVYNKERQSIITKEISEIMGGAEAIS